MLNLVSDFSYCNEQITEMTPHLPVPTKFRAFKILEFGAGDSTIKLYQYYKEIYGNIEYTCYESNPSYLPKAVGTLVPILHRSVQEVEVKDNIYDLVLVDGPSGPTRALWYKKLVGKTRPGTIIHVDDFNQYAEYLKELSLHHTYDVLFNHPRARIGLKYWYTVKIK